MIETRLDVNIVNPIKFIILELLISIVLEPAWELIISRVAHYRIIRGHRVPLASIPHSRTFPCALSIGSVSRLVAIVLSLTVLGGSLASEYAVDVTSKPVPHIGNTTVHARRLGRGADLLRHSESYPDSVDRTTNISITVTQMADRCSYHNTTTNRYFVNASFETQATQEQLCVDNDSEMSYEVPVTCTLTSKQAHDNYCIWNRTTEKFETTIDYSESFEENWFEELFASNRSIQLHECNHGSCERQNVTFGTGVGITANLYCITRQDIGQNVCVYVSERWVVLSWFHSKSGLPSRASSHPVIVYRNSRGMEALEPMSQTDIRVLEYFQTMLDFAMGTAGFSLNREREGYVMMLMLEGFGRPEDRVSIRDYRKDDSQLFTTIDWRLFVPLAIATVVLVAGALIALVLTPKRKMVLQPPVSIEQMFACARAREEPGSDTWWGSEEKLDMGIVQDERGTQRFSVSAELPCQYKPGLRNSYEPVDGNEIFVK